MGCNSVSEEGASCSADATKPSKFDLADSSREWRSWEQPEASTSPAWNSEDDEDSGSCAPGTRPSDLYGKFTWKIENFSQISKRELRSDYFEVGGYKWYILVYPQGCDVCNHLSLFLCVADYDKLLPGWSHFAQFTIAVVNKDPKKSKYSDTLHRFCKKEHDWGWKKFMELSKVLDGFTVADTLVIKAQVQVIRENPHRPFRCLDFQYRRELVRVYLSNVEGICRRFVEEKRDKIGKLREDAVRWSSFRAFWLALEENMQRRLSREKTDAILKLIVKFFFNEKEVTSTLVMDALYSGYKALDYRSKNKKGKSNMLDSEDSSSPIIWIEKESFVLADDVLLLLERAANESMPLYKEDKGPQNRTKDGCSGDDLGRDNLERDERRLTELGRRTVEMFVLSHLFSRVEVAYLEAIALKRQEELIREEEAAGQAEMELKARREAAEKEKRNKKKQAKQRRNSRKEKEKAASGKLQVQQSRQREDSTSSRATISSLSKGTSMTGDDDDDSSVLDNVDGIVGTLRPTTEDGEADQIIWDRERSDTNNGMEAGFSGYSCIESSQNGRTTRKQNTLIDDSSSTCSSDSIPSIHATANGTNRRRPSIAEENSTNRTRGRVVSDNVSRHGETALSLQGRSGTTRMESSCSCRVEGSEVETIISSLKKRVQWLQQRLSEKEEEVLMLHKQLSLYQHQFGTDLPSGDGKNVDCEQSQTDADIIPSTPIKQSTENLKSESRSEEDTQKDRVGTAESTAIDCSNESNIVTRSCTPDISVTPSASSISGSHGLSNGQDLTSISSTPAVDANLSRPSSAPSAPGVPASSRASPVVVQLPPSALARSVSAAGRLGVTGAESTSSSNRQHGLPVIPSYRNAAAGVIRSRGLSTSSSPFIPASDTSANPPHVGVPLESREQTAAASPVSEPEVPCSLKNIKDKITLPTTPKTEKVGKVDVLENQQNSMGFTFGTVTAEMLHLQQQRLQQIETMASNSVRETDSSAQKLSHALDQHFEDTQNGKGLHNHVQHNFHSTSRSPESLHTNLLLQKSLTHRVPVQYLQSRQTGLDINLPGAVLPEEFPHLDIINDLLDDDKMLLLQQSGHQGFQSHLTAHDLHRMYSESLDRGMPHDNGGMAQFAFPPDGIISGLGESMSYTRSPLRHSLSHHSMEAIPEHFWQGPQGDLPATSGANGFQNDVDVFMGYPMQNSHMSLADYPPFSMGQTGYSIYSPIKHP